MGWLTRPGPCAMVIVRRERRLGFAVPGSEVMRWVIERPLWVRSP